MQICVVDGTAYQRLAESNRERHEPDVQQCMRLQNKEVLCLPLRVMVLDNVHAIGAFDITALEQSVAASSWVWLAQQHFGRSHFLCSCFS